MTMVAKKLNYCSWALFGVGHEGRRTQKLPNWSHCWLSVYETI